MSNARPSWHKPAAAIGATLIGAATIALGAFVGLGVWLVAVLGGGALGAAATLAALGISGAARGTLSAGRQAQFDPVTELPNVGQLRADLERVLASDPPVPHTLYVHALDGLKRYDDAYGDACADALLSWLARKLRDAVGARGTVYRMRGGGFAVLAARREHAIIELRTDAISELRADTSAALFEVGDGFVIWSTAAEVRLPDEARDVEGALELADRRAHSVNHDHRADVDLHPPDDPIDALSLVRPRYDVAELARRIGRRLGAAGAALDDLEAATQLRDVGNAAVPSAVLTHAGELPGHEWQFIRLHTVVGERLIAGTFGMEGAAKLVRSSHERFDGAGYPDGLRGERIPLGARIVFVCSAFEDMTCERPHRPALELQDALAELDRGAGTQFDPEVVRAFQEAFAAERELVRGDRLIRARRPMRVLLAAADPVARFLLRRSIESAGHECVAVADGLSAWETYRRALPEVVISEMLMPQLGGVELCRRIRAGAAQQPYFVLLAGAGGNDEVRRLTHPDVDDVLPKPVDRVDLEVTLSRAVSMTARRQASSA